MDDGRRNIGYIIGPVTNNKEEGWKKECWTWSCRRMPAAQASKHWRSHSKGLTASIHGASRHGGRKEDRAGKREERRRRARTSQASGVAVLCFAFLLPRTSLCMGGMPTLRQASKHWEHRGRLTPASASPPRRRHSRRCRPRPRPRRAPSPPSGRAHPGNDS